MSSPLRTPAHPDNRDSVASGGFTSIGNMLSSPYDDDEDHPEVIRTPVTPPRKAPPAHPRLGTVRESKYQPPRKAALVERVQSFEGQVDQRESYYDSDEEQGTVLAFDRPSPSSPAKSTQTAESGRVRPPTVVHFPEPTISPLRSPAPIRHHQPPRPIIHIPNTPTRSAAPIRAHSPGGQFTIPALPCSGTPVSPHLALPRSPFAMVNSPGARGSVSSISSESIKGFDLMKEKKALFREGQEELLTPFSPRRIGGGQESGLRPGPRKGVGRGVSTVDFWKRFSVSVRLDQVAGKERWVVPARSCDIN